MIEDLKEAILQKIGPAAMYEQLAEECAELAQAALKLARIERGENPTPKTREQAWADFLEETADVELVLAQIPRTMADFDAIRETREKKKQRWKERLGI